MSSRVALLQAPDRLVDLGGLDRPSVGNAFCQLVDIGTRAPFLLGTDGAIFGDALLAGAQPSPLNPGQKKSSIEVKIQTADQQTYEDTEGFTPVLRELSNVLLISHAAIHDHGGPFLKLGVLGQTIELALRSPWQNTLAA